MTDPRYPKRPNHPDFWLISEVLVSQDASADQRVEPFEDMVGRFVDIDSLQYAAEEQTHMMVQRADRGKLVYTASEVKLRMVSIFMGAFVHGIRFQIRKQRGSETDLLTLQESLELVAEAAAGDSNDRQIQTLNNALEVALTRWPELEKEAGA